MLVGRPGVCGPVRLQLALGRRCASGLLPEGRGKGVAAERGHGIDGGISAIGWNEPDLHGAILQKQRGGGVEQTRRVEHLSTELRGVAAEFLPAQDQRSHIRHAAEKRRPD